MNFRKNTIVSVAGRSLWFNVLFVVLNILGLMFVTIAYHEGFSGNVLAFKITGFSLLALAIGGLIFFKGTLMMGNVARVVIGGLFIVSGLVKANDPLGFAYKLEEYFEDGALAYRIKELLSIPSFSLEFLIGQALLISVIICILEIVLGILLIIGGKIKLVSYLLVAMMVFFTFLTWHTATCDSGKKFLDRDTYVLSTSVAQTKLEQAKSDADIRIVSNNGTTIVVDEMKQPQCVDDCGCFGDAMKGSIGRSLTPYESLWKDIIVLYLGIWIFMAQWFIRPNTRSQNVVFSITSLAVVAFFADIFSWYFPLLFAIVAIFGSLWLLRIGGRFGNYWSVSLFVSLISALFAFMVLRYEPLKDYRPYAVGANLIENMNNGEKGVYQNMLLYVNSKTGEQQLFDSSSKEFSDSKIWESKEWTFKEMVQKTIKPTKLPSITDQFSPYIRVADLSNIEQNFDYVNQFISNHQVQIVRVKNISSEDIYEVPRSEFSIEEYSPEYYEIIDTLQKIDPDIEEIHLRDYIVSSDAIVVLISKNIQQANWKYIDRYKTILEELKKRNIPVIMLSSASRETMEEFRKKYKFDIPMFTNDEIELKAIARSNPSMMIIKKGVVVDKFSHRTTPTFEWLNKKIFAHE